MRSFEGSFPGPVVSKWICTRFEDVSRWWRGPPDETAKCCEGTGNSHRDGEDTDPGGALATLTRCDIGVCDPTEAGKRRGAPSRKEPPTSVRYGFNQDAALRPAFGP